MDITPQDNTATQPISDDQELAKALAGVLPDEPDAVPPADPSLEFEEIKVPTPAEPITAIDDDAKDNQTSDPTADDSTDEVPVVAEPAAAELPSLVSLDAAAATPLEGIKTEALNELRPLLDHVDLPPEEKFDIYLMLLRSTDDGTLVDPAHTAAQNIVDDKRKAEALLDIIKEIDYLSRKHQPPP